MALWHRYAWIAYLAIFIGVCGHASSEFVSVLTKLSGPEVSVWRFLIGGAGLLVVALLMPGSRNILTPLQQYPLQMLTLAGLGVTVAFLLFHWSLDFATVPQIATIVTTSPIWIGLINMKLNNQPFTTSKIVTGICALIGVTLLITDGYLGSLVGTSDNIVGMLMALACVILGSTYMVMAKPYIQQYGSFRFMGVTMFTGGIGLWLVVGFFWSIWVNPFTLFQLPVEQAVSILTLGIFNTTIAMFLYAGGLAAVPDMTKGGYLFFLKPVIALTLTYLFLEQEITGWQIVAIAVICLSVFGEFLVTRGK